MVDWDLASYLAESFCLDNMTSEVEVWRKTAPVFDTATGMLASKNDKLVYVGKARVHAVTGPLTMAVGDEPQYFSSTTISIPERVETIPQVDDVVTITDCPDDKAIGRSYRVTDVGVGGQMHSALAMSCTGIQPARNA